MVKCINVETIKLSLLLFKYITSMLSIFLLKKSYTEYIMSCCCSPSERLSGFVDHFLQDGMQKLDSFLKGTKDTLKVIEEVNEKIYAGQLNLDGVAVVQVNVNRVLSCNQTRLEDEVAVVSLDIVSISEELATNACKD